MSHEANIYCNDCNKECDDSFKYGYIDSLLKLYVKILRENYKELKGVYYQLQIECYEGLSSFIYDHIEHDIIIKGEYENDPEIKL